MSRAIYTFLGIVFVLVLGACTSAGLSVGTEIAVGPNRQPPITTSTTLPSTPPLQDLVLTPVAVGLDQPVAISAAPGIGDTFIVERSGTVVTLESGGAVTVLDISDRITDEGNEQGLLAFAPHPNFPQDTRAIAIYTDVDGDVVVSSFDWVEDRFDPASESVILNVPQPHYYHQGGGIAFGPEGYLWMSFGDGGGIGDRYQNGQDPTTIQGTIVRIDIDNGDPFVLPPTNPFLDGEKGAPMVWAFGLRNPWRITVDSGNLIIADVGQEGFEEINIVPTSGGGENFGWPVLEGNDCYNAAQCESDGFTAPALVIDSTRACALIGGPVYRGVAIPELHGQFVFGDFCRGWMSSVEIIDGELGAVTEWEPMLGPIGNITTFGLDHTGELLVATLEGSVSRIDPVR